MADEGESNPFVDRMKKLVEDSTDAKRIEHDRSVAKLQELNKQRVKELIEKDNQRLEQIEKSEEILLADALEAVDSITPEMMIRDGSISFISEAFAFIDGEKSLSRIKNVCEDISFINNRYGFRYSTVRMDVVGLIGWKESKPSTANPFGGRHEEISSFQYTPLGDLETNEDKKYSTSGLESVGRTNIYAFGGVKEKWSVDLQDYLISPNGKSVIAHVGTELYFGSLRTKKMYNSIRLDNEVDKHRFAFSPDGKFIAIGVRNTLKIIDAWTTDPHAEIRTKHKIKSIIFHPCLPILIVAHGVKYTIFEYESSGLTEYRVPRTIDRISISPDGRMLAIAYDDCIRFCEFGNFGKHREYKARYPQNVGETISSLAFNPLGIDELDGFWGMLTKVQDFISQSGLKLTTEDLINFELSWKRQVDI